MLGAAEADAARAERVRQLGLVRQIGVGADAHAAELVRPGEQLLEALVELRLLRAERAVHHLQDLARLRRDLGELHLARQAVEREVVAFLHRLAADAKLLGGFVDLERARADDRRLAHLAADDGGVRRHAAGGREDALRDEHAVDVVRHGFAAQWAIT